MSGDRVIVLPIIRKHGKFVDEYKPLDVYKILSMSFRGSYNDYGTLEDIDENPLSQFSVDIFSKLFASRRGLSYSEEDFNTGEGLPFDNPEKICHAIERGYIFTKADPTRTAYQLMMHEEAFNTFVDTLGNRAPLLFDEPNPYKSNRALFEAALKELPKKLEVYDPILSCPSIPSLFGYAFHDGLLIAREYCEKYINSPEATRGLIDVFLFVDALAFSRKVIYPTIGKGSQIAEVKLQEALANFTKKHVSQILEENKEAAEDKYSPYTETYYVNDLIDRKY